MIAPSEARRIEAGIFNDGSDIRIEDTPLHVSGLERFVEWDQDADFLGRRRLEEIRDGDLLDRKLVGIEIGGEPMTDEGALNDFWPLFDGRCACGEDHGRRVVPPAPEEHRLRVGADPLGAARVGVRGRDPAGRVPVTVASLPFVDPTKDIPKS